MSSSLQQCEKGLREDAVSIFKAGLEAVDANKAIRRHLRRHQDCLEVGNKRYFFTEYKRIIVVGAGKAAAAMAKGVEEIMGDKIDDGLINVKYGHLQRLEKIKVNEAGHPLPDESGIKGTARIVDLLAKAQKEDLVICLLSGGGSALLVSPVAEISLEDKRKTTDLLLKCGARIEEINAVRKHLSRVKGGQLARIVYPATIISLILSDVVGDPLETIASGPTYPDSTTFKDCIDILKGYHIYKQLPLCIRQYLQCGAHGNKEETPKPDDPIFEKAQNIIIGNNFQSLKAAQAKARELGYKSFVLSSSIQGETREVARVHAAVAKEILTSGNPIESPACVISGGETTVTVKGKGLGGRNQEFVLAVALDIAGLKSVVVLSGGTDGTDGPTDAAGAIADGYTVKRAQDIGLDPWEYLEDNDSYHFFDKLGDLLITGPTNTNVMDLRLVLVGKKYK